MKKLFICALALASVVACSKDDVDPVLTSKMKSVSVTIQNSKMNATRATVTGDYLNPTAVGGAAGVTAQVTEDETLVADLSTLKILFANAQGVVVKAMNLVNTPDNNIHNGENATNTGEYVPGVITDQTYTFHRVPETVVTVAVIRDTKNLVQINENSTTLAQVQAGALNAEQNLPVGVQDIFLYAEEDLTQSNQHYTATVDGVETKYFYYDATLNIKPQFARFELVEVSCDDLGKYNVDEDDNTYGLDELVIDDFTMTVASKAYTYEWTSNNHLYGQYCDNYTDATIDPAHPTTSIFSINAGKVGEGENAKDAAWSWNLPAADVDFSVATGVPMVLNLTASAHDYIVNNPAKKVRVVALTDSETKAAISKFEKGKEYRLALEFSEDNIDQTDDQLCVRATVVVSNWDVVVVTPTFGTNPPATPAQ